MPGLSGSDLAVTPARAGLLRSGAGRSGWPIFVGVVVKKYAQSGVARAGATRSNYHSGITAISIGGTHYGAGRAVDAQKVLAGTLSISDLLNETPNTARFRTMGFTPTTGQEVIITLGSKNNLDRRFAGQILTVDQGYVGTPANYHHDVSVIDFTWGLNKRKVSGYFTGSATTIAESLVSTYAVGYTAAIEQGLATVPGGITFTNQDLADCLTQLAKRIDGRWVCDYRKVVRLFVTETTEATTAQTIVNAVHLSLTDVRSTRDLSQVVTRVHVEGGGVTAFATCAVGETILPLDGDPQWYDSAGGTVVSGPQRITYTGVSTSAGGGLVGTGAAPSGAPVLALVSGAGIEDGAHDYAVTFVTGAGESIASPLVSITNGDTAAPTEAPTAGTPTIGTGPNPGSHDYAVTYVTSSGETTAGASVTKATTATTAPSTAPVPGTPTSGTGPDDGLHDYAVTFVTSIGETEPSSIGSSVLTGPLAPPATAPTPGTATAGGSVTTGTHGYVATFVTALGETLAGTVGNGTTGTSTAPASAPTAGTPVTGAGSVTVGTHDYAVTFVTATGETTPSANTTRTMTATQDPPGASTAAVAAGAGVDAGPHDYAVTFVTATGETSAGTTSNQVTTVAGSATPATGAAQPVTTLDGNGSPFALDVGADYLWKYTHRRTSDGTETAGSPATPSFTATADGAAYVDGTGLPAVPVGYTRIWYRTEGGGATYKTVVGAHASAAGLVDGTSDASLGAVIPASNNTERLQVDLTAIPTGAANVTARKVYRNNGAGFLLLTTIADNVTTTYTDTTANASLGAAIPGSNTAILQRIPLTAIPIGAAEVTQRKIYRTTAGGAQLKLLTTIANNSATTYTDTTADAGLGAAVPGSNTATLNTIPLTAIPLGVASVTQRKIYRSLAGAGAPYKLLTTIANNSATTYSDTTADGSLGADAPSSATAAFNVVPLTAIPVGDANVTSRKVYRRSGGAGLKLLTTIANNTATTYTDTTVNASLGAAAPATTTAYLQRIPLTAIPVSPSALVLSKNVYGTAAGGSQLKLIANIAAAATTYTVVATDASLGANVPVTNTATVNRTSLTSIPIGAATVTQRKIYRTVAAGSQLKLLATLADNTTSTYADSTADASLGANVPTSDTSGLTQPGGNVLAGSTSLVVASIGPFQPSGWAVIGNGQQVIRYTGISGSVLTGIPASGAGAIIASIAFNSTVTSAPVLTGIPSSGTGSILYAILKGADVNIFETVNDTAAQTALGALIGGDGIQEAYIQDRRLAKAEAQARGTAHLALKSAVEVTVRYRCRDINTKSGQTVTINLGAPTSIAGDFIIQSVTVTDFFPALMPTFDVVASSSRFTLEDLLRFARGAQH